MNVLERIQNGINHIRFLFSDWNEQDETRIGKMQLRRDYREGRHKQQIKPKPGRTDDNVYINFSGLVIDRSISMLFGKGIEFDLPGEGDDTPEDKYIKAVWDANKQEIFLHKLGMSGGTDGTGYIKIVPDELEFNGIVLPRLVKLNGALVNIKTSMEDYEKVLEYKIQWSDVEDNGNEIARKQTHTPTDNNTWLIQDYRASNLTGGKWQLFNAEEWPYKFSQILHFQNLPDDNDIYGKSDITDDLIGLQDKVNFVASNINKIIRLHAHPTIYTTINSAQKDVIDSSIGEVIGGVSPDGFIKAVEMQSDLSSSSNFFTVIRQAFFDIARTVDIDSVADKLGALTNFALKVLYQDALDKNDTKRELYGDALLELNRRLLVIAGLNPDPGEIVWKDALPENGIEVSQELKTDMEIGILSIQTASIMKGYDYEQEQERINEQNTNEGTVGDEILKLFERGGQNVNNQKRGNR
jgi:hypothetical protein